MVKKSLLYFDKKKKRFQRSRVGNVLIVIIGGSVEWADSVIERNELNFERIMLETVLKIRGPNRTG